MLMNIKISFNNAYKTWRNRARRYSPESIVRTALQSLQKPASSRLEDMQQAPWLTLLLVKWVCQDRMADHRVGEPITLEAFDDLRQRLWNFPEQIDLGTRDTLPVNLFVRQHLRPQIGFQRSFTPGFMREAALLAQQPQNDPLRCLFEQKTGIGIDEYLDLTFATYAAILNGKRRLDIGWFEPLRATYTETLIDAYIACVSRTFPELLTFCRSLRDASVKRASEFYEFPVLSRYPFLRTGNTLECWHPAVFYRGMEGFVHSVLSEAGQDYMDRFSKLFEQHVLGEARNLQAPFFNEDDLKALLPIGVKVPDGLLSYPDCNVFVESKAGMFDESLMTVGHSEIFAHKTRALKKAACQAWSASVALRQQGRAASNVATATRDYLLIVTNKELSASRGTVLAEMYPPGTLVGCRKSFDR